MKIISFENHFSCNEHLLIPCKIYCVELEIVHNNLGLNAIENCALKLKESGIKDKELKDFLGLKGELEPLLDLILEKIETKTHPEYKTIYTHFYCNLINQKFLHFVDLERVRTRNGNELKDNRVEFCIDDRSINAESLYYPKENDKQLNSKEAQRKINGTIETSIKYHQQDVLRHAKVGNFHVLEGIYYLHAKAFNDDGKLRIECKNHPIGKMAKEELTKTHHKWMEKWNEKQYTQTGDPKQSKRIKVFEKPTAFDDRLHIIEWNLSNLDNENKKLKICGALYDIYEQIFETPSLKGCTLGIYKAEDSLKKFKHLGFEEGLKDLKDARLNALLYHHEKIMQALAKNYPSFLQDLNDLKKYRNKDKHGGESQDDIPLTRVELERYRDEIYFLIENLLKNSLIEDREKDKKERSHYRKNAEIDTQTQLLNLNVPKLLFGYFVEINLAKYDKNCGKGDMVLNFCKIFETILIKVIKKQPNLVPKTKNEILENSSYELKNSLKEVREDFLTNAFKYKVASLGAYGLVLLSCGYFESVFEEVQEWLDFIARLITLREHGHKMTKELEELKEEDLKRLKKQALEYFKKIAIKTYPKESQ